MKSELSDHITDADTVDAIKSLTETAIDADAIARVVAFAIEQPADVNVDEIIVRPTVQTL